MIIPASGREYANFPIPEDTPETATLTVTFDEGATWHAMDRPSPGVARVLVAGPLSADNPAGTATLALGTNYASVRLASSPENVIRPAGAIHVTATP